MITIPLSQSLANVTRHSSQRLPFLLNAMFQLLNCVGCWRFEDLGFQVPPEKKIEKTVLQKSPDSLPRQIAALQLKEFVSHRHSNRSVHTHTKIQKKTLGNPFLSENKTASVRKPSPLSHYVQAQARRGRRERNVRATSRGKERQEIYDNTRTGLAVCRVNANVNESSFTDELAYATRRDRIGAS